MILKPTGRILSRHAVQQIAKENENVTEIDFSEVEIIGGSTMHQFICSFPGVKMTGLVGWNAQEYEFVLRALDAMKNDKHA